MAGATARRLGIYLGAGAAETDGTDFFNVFTLAGPDGQIAGRAYKTNAEASIFRRGRAAHLIDTPAGRIGVGICADNQFAATLEIMHEQDADLVLMPHAWPWYRSGAQRARAGRCWPQRWPCRRVRRSPRPGWPG